MLRFALLGCVIAALALAGCGSGNRAEGGSTESGKGGKAGDKAAAPRRPTTGALVQGDVALPGDQPPAPPLPENVDLTTDEQELAAHAHLSAREEVAVGLITGVTIEQRQDFILRVWSPQMAQKQIYLRKIADDRNAYADYNAKIAGMRAKQDRDLAAIEADFQAKTRVERTKTAPITE